jgi:hypothetical protein
LPYGTKWCHGTVKIVLNEISHFAKMAGIQILKTNLRPTDTNNFLSPLRPKTMKRNETTKHEIRNNETTKRNNNSETKQRNETTTAKRNNETTAKQTETK